MKKKYLIIILVFLIILLISILAIKSVKTDSSKDEETSRDFILNDNTVSKTNTHGENTGIFVGTPNNFLLISVKINKNGSKEDQANELISAISKVTGYKIDINSIEIAENNIKIDFAKTAAPFELEESYSNNGDQQYYISSEALVKKTLFESINKTLKSYFGESTEIHFSADSEDIDF